MKSIELRLDIRPAQRDELERIRVALSPRDFAGHHQQRFCVQSEGQGIYLIAWHGEEPIGHFLLRWAGPESDPTGSYPYPTPYLEAGQTRLDYRRKGVATRLIQAAEAIARERGDRAIGLAVGSFDNPDARRLYESLGYVDWDNGEFLVSWGYRDADGNEGIESEDCIYMFKEQ